MMRLNYLIDDDGRQRWILVKDIDAIEFTTDEIIELYNQLEVHKELNWKSPF